MAWRCDRYERAQFLTVYLRYIRHAKRAIAAPEAIEPRRRVPRAEGRGDTDSVTGSANTLCAQKFDPNLSKTLPILIGDIRLKSW